MEMNRENYFDFLWPNYSKIIGEGYTEKPLEWPNFFKEEKSNNAYEKYREANGLPVWEENFEGQPYNEAERSLGHTITIYNRRYDQAFKITWEYFSDNKERAMGGEGINGDARMLGRGCRMKQEITASEIINNGFTNVGYDGVALFSTAHPLTKGGTCANTPLNEGDKALSDVNLKKGITEMSKQTDNIGIKIQVKPNKLGVASDLYFTALTIVNSALVAGTSNNDKNVIGTVAPLTVHQMSYWDNGIWVLQDSSIDNLIFQWRERPEFGHYNIQGTADHMIYGRARWGVGYRDWRGLYGAKQSA